LKVEPHPSPPPAEPRSPLCAPSPGAAQLSNAGARQASALGGVRGEMAQGFAQSRVASSPLAPRAVSAADESPFGVAISAGALAAAGFGFGAQLMPTRLATPEPPSRAPGLPLSLVTAAPTMTTHLPTPKFSLRMRSALPPSPQLGAGGTGGAGLFRPAPSF
jgi:hypothetical protein